MKENIHHFFNLAANPFGETPDPRFFFPSITHQSALEGLLQSISAGKGFTLLTGEVGAGKTLLTRIFLKSLGNSVDSALVLYPHCNETELLRTVLEELELDSSGDDHKRLLDRLNAMLLREDRRDRKTVLIIDEAQNLPNATLEAIRLLGNLETEQRKLLNIVLVGHPELLTRLDANEHRQLRQRVGVSLELAALDRLETEEYIKHRLERAGGGNLVRFAPEATALIHRISRGIPREINRICERALEVSLKNRVRLVGKSEIQNTQHSSRATKRSWFAKIIAKRHEGRCA